MTKANFYLKYQTTIIKLISGAVTAIIFAIVFYFTTKTAMTDFDRRIEANTEAINNNSEQIKKSKKDDVIIIENLNTVIDNLKEHIEEQGGKWKERSQINLQD